MSVRHCLRISEWKPVGWGQSHTGHISTIDTVLIIGVLIAKYNFLVFWRTNCLHWLNGTLGDQEVSDVLVSWWERVCCCCSLPAQTREWLSLPFYNKSGCLNSPGKPAGSKVLPRARQVRRGDAALGRLPDGMMGNRINLKIGKYDLSSF